MTMQTRGRWIDFKDHYFNLNNVTHFGKTKQNVPGEPKPAPERQLYFLNAYLVCATDSGQKYTCLGTFTAAECALHVKDIIRGKYDMDVYPSAMEATDA